MKAFAKRLGVNSKGPKKDKQSNQKSIFAVVLFSVMFLVMSVNFESHRLHGCKLTRR